MSGENFNNPNVKLRALIAPLDWGLGHATRCIPIIKELIANGLEVMIAASGVTETLLKKEFPNLKYLYLKGYNISYSRKKKWFFFRILAQLPKINNTIRYEHRWLKKQVSEHGIELVIADNRPGLYHDKIPSIYITHQLQIISGNAFSEAIGRNIHYHYINQFTACWVPDAEGNTNLAGLLSHPRVMPKIPVAYLGPLSRFEKKNGLSKKHDLLILLSGPEPQRTLLEEKIMDELKTYHGSVVLVRGLPNGKTVVTNDQKNIQQYNHLTAEQLNDLIQESHLVICRSGYTTIMDLAKLQQKAVLVPTPGQTEQEYLAEYLLEKKMFYSVQQENFLMEKITAAANDFPFTFPDVQEIYKTVIKKYLTSL